jgi:glycerol uptake facilitator protein
MAQMRGKTGWRATVWGELFSEFLGTLILLAFGAGGDAVAVVGLTMSGRTLVIFQGAGGWLLITWGWALGVTFAVYVAGGISGAYINPAVSLALAIRKAFPWKKVIPYSVAQTLGAFCGAAIVYLDYYHAVDAWNLAHHVVSRASSGGLTTFSIWATFPAKYFHGQMGFALLDQIIATFFLVLFVLAVIDTKNLSVQSNMGPFIIGMAVMAIGVAFGVGTGYAINPARDLGPRIFLWLEGWGKNAFPGPYGYWWVPILGPLIGSSIAAFAYRYFIELTLIKRQEANANAESQTTKEELAVSNMTPVEGRDNQ